MTHLHVFKVLPGMLILLFFLLKHELGLENWISNVPVLFDFYLTLDEDDDLHLIGTAMEHFQEQFVRDWCSEQRLSYEKSLRWCNAETRTCFYLEWSLEAQILGFFRFLEIWTLCSHPDILIWISVALSRKLQAISIMFCTVGSSQCSGTVDESPCFWLPDVNVCQRKIFTVVGREH